MLLVWGEKESVQIFGEETYQKMFMWNPEKEIGE
jgi:hypothetical protein